ncbi:MAG: cobalamin biosynthesis protein CobD [Synergistaceae bacterium]|nr:cobalamin biosynthesis protein CobD [Synergistaceae bacterium]
MRFTVVLCLAVIADWIFGDPRNFPHPVKLIGNAINFWHKIFFRNNESFMRGLAVVLMTLITAGFFFGTLLYVSGCNILMEVYLLYSALAWRDLKDETAPIFFSLINHDLTGARKYLSFVVGRDTENLDEVEITRSTIETIAENSIDGVISVMFFAGLGHALNPQWGMVISVWLFKAASTLDSMLGYESYGKYGKASARLDDVLNFLPARIGGLIIVLSGAFTGGKVREGFRVFMTDRLKHRSPNSAHGESAFAGVLGVRLGGGAFYGGEFVSRPFINGNGSEPSISDIVRTWKVLDVSCGIFILMVIFLTWTL